MQLFFYTWSESVPSNYQKLGIFFKLNMHVLVLYYREIINFFFYFDSIYKLCHITCCGFLYWTLQDDKLPRRTVSLGENDFGNTYLIVNTPFSETAMFCIQLENSCEICSYIISLLTFSAALRGKKYMKSSYSKNPNTNQLSNLGPTTNPILILFANAN
jgi:hypothetical protein